MTDRRLQLQTILSDIPGVTKAYFQAPGSEKMVYPCILYALDEINTQHADNLPYHVTKRYQVTVIDRNPDSTIPDAVAQLPLSSFSRFFVSDSLNHYVFALYF